MVSHLAGPSAGPGYADGPAATARFAFPWGVAVDADGITYVADSANHTIRTISAAGEVTTIAGASGAPGSADGPGAAARFRFPTGVVAGPGGVLYVCDSGNHTVRRIAATGEVTTLAGAAGQAGTADGSGAEARFSRPLRAAIDDAGNLLVADSGNHTIRFVTPAGVVTTVAGLAGQPGSTDGGADVAKLNGPAGLAVGISSGGTLFWVADSENHTVRRVGGPGATVSTLAGAAGTAGSADGAGATARFDRPHDLTRALGLGLAAADTGNHTVRLLDAAGGTRTLAGTAGSPGFTDGTGAAARFNEPRGIATGAERYLVADTGNHAVRAVAGDGAATTVAGSATPAGAADGAAADARFRAPSGVALNAGGGVFVADTDNHVIRSIAPDGTVSTLAGAAGAAGSADGLGDAARFDHPYGIAVDAQGVVYVADQGNHTVRTVSPGGVAATLAGAAGSAGADDGAGAAARFNAPAGIALGAGGKLYVADRDNHVIRAVAADGTVSTLAGAAGAAGNADGSGPAARFDHPVGVCVHPLTGDLLVADRGNRSVRVVTPAGAVTTLLAAGTAGWAPAAFTDPVGVAADASGAVFVTNEDGHDVVVLTPVGELRALAGAPGTPGNVDGAGTAARFFRPRGVAAGALGTLVVADSGSNALRGVTYEPAAGGCAEPVIVSQSGDMVVQGGDSATVSVTAAGTPPLAFQWYSGQPGDTANPIPGATTATYSTGPLAQTATVWARATNACGHADSGAITLTVCTWALAPASASFAHTGGAGTANVVTAAPCAWTATASAEWVTFPAGAAGTGPATLAYAVAANPGAARTATITVAGATHTVTQALLPRYFVSSVAHAPGAGGTRWRTDLAIVNRGASPVAMTLTFWPYGGGEGLAAGHLLAAGAAIEWKDVLVSLFEQTATSVKGSVQIDASAPVLISSRTYNLAAKGTYGQEYPAVTTGEALTSGAIGYLPQLAKSAALRTNVGVLNLGDADVAVAIKVFTAAGAQAGTTKEATVKPARYWQQDDIFTATGAGDLEGAWATVEVLTAGGRVWAYASVIDNGTGDPTTVPVQFAVPPGPYLVSSQAHLKGAGGTQWRSSLAVVNPGAAEAPLTLTYRPYGSGDAIVREHPLAAGAAVEWQDALVSLFGYDAAANVKGSVEIAAPLPVVIGARTYNQAAKGTYGQGYPAIAPAQALRAGQVGVLPQLRKDAATRTNVGVLNVGMAEVTVEVRLFDATGAPVGGVTSATVAAGRYWQQDDIFTSSGAGTQALAYATVDVQTPGGAVWAYASVIDTVTGDPTTVAVQPQ